MEITSPHTKKLDFKAIARKIIKATKTGDEKIPIALSNDKYIEELFRDTQTHQIKINIKKFTEEERKNAQLTYDRERQILLTKDSKFASTLGKSSKDIYNTSGFVLGPNNKLYLFNHDRIDNIYYVHGSIFNDMPVKMAGLISIYNGKITDIFDDSGHYRPDVDAMYKFIKTLESTMPGVIDESTCVIHYKFNGILYEDFIKDFLKLMEEKDFTGKSYYENSIANKTEKKEKDLKKYTTISFNSFISQGVFDEALKLLENKSERIDLKLINSGLINRRNINLFISKIAISHYPIEQKRRFIEILSFDKPLEQEIQKLENTGERLSKKLKIAEISPTTNENILEQARNIKILPMESISKIQTAPKKRKRIYSK